MNNVLFFISIKNKMTNGIMLVSNWSAFIQMSKAFCLAGFKSWLIFAWLIVWVNILAPLITVCMSGISVTILSLTLWLAFIEVIRFWSLSSERTSSNLICSLKIFQHIKYITTMLYCITFEIIKIYSIL